MFPILIRIEIETHRLINPLGIRTFGIDIVMMDMRQFMVTLIGSHPVNKARMVSNQAYFTLICVYRFLVHLKLSEQ